jgi:hypothetical protein
MAKRVCSKPGCSRLIPESGFCTEHRRTRERSRGSRQARGYNAGHDRLRAEWEPRVATGTVKCWRCKQLIDAAGPWHLGHDDHDRSVHRGPEHTRCNLSAAGRASHGLPARPVKSTRPDLSADPPF